MKNLNLFAIFVMVCLLESCELNNPTTPNESNVFSVSADNKVTFSMGNLQYHPANDEWRFAESQLDYIGNANNNISNSYNGWIDLFGWSTNSTHFGVSISDKSKDYYGIFIDWGTNKIGNDASNTWRTLTHSEWFYLFYERADADLLCGIAQVNGVNGIILLPDNWTCPNAITFKSGFYNRDGKECYAIYQSFTIEQWSILEKAGAIFLPATGYRRARELYQMQDFGYYWSSTESAKNGATVHYLATGAAKVDMLHLIPNYGISVRLVKDL